MLGSPCVQLVWRAVGGSRELVTQFVRRCVPLPLSSLSRPWNVGVVLGFQLQHGVALTLLNNHLYCVNAALYIAVPFFEVVTAGLYFQVRNVQGVQHCFALFNARIHGRPKMSPCFLASRLRGVASCCAHLQRESSRHFLFAHEFSVMTAELAYLAGYISVARSLLRETTHVVRCIVGLFVCLFRS